MEPVPQNVRLVKRTYWFIRLRWIAIAGVVTATFLAGKLFDIALQQKSIYIVCAMLFLYNLSVFLLLTYFKNRNNDEDIYFPAVKKIINLQISADLIFLTVLLHFAGGVENPFVVYFVFHMIMASILLSVLESYFQATLAMVLLTLLAVLEYQGIIDHYPMAGFIPHDSHRDGIYIFGKVAVLASTLYLVVFMTSSIAVQSRRHEKGYRQANIQLREQDRLKNEYVSRVTHDIKGDLAAIQSCLDVVANKMVGPLTDKQNDFISKANNRTKKLNVFVRTLLRLTQIRLSRKMDMKEFPLKEAIASALSSVQVRADEKAITLDSKIEPKISTIVGNQFSIEELLSNLLLNAIKYTGPNGTITLNATNSKNVVRLAISDTGIGIAADEIGHIFDEFYRASNAKESVKDGTGLGLSIVKQIVERHGGTISVRSQLNKGTTFLLTLPKTQKIIT
jgi:signal transduction histidine kinase